MAKDNRYGGFTAQINHPGGQATSQKADANNDKAPEQKLLNPAANNDADDREPLLAAPGNAARTAAENKNFQEQYEAACWKIVDEMNDKFIDLCVDDNHSNYGNEMPQRQERFRAHLEKLNFRFNTNCLEMPPMPADASHIDKNVVEGLREADREMGQQLDSIFNLLNQSAEDQFHSKDVIITHQWDDRRKIFED